MSLEKQKLQNLHQEVMDKLTHFHRAKGPPGDSEVFPLWGPMMPTAFHVSWPSRANSTTKMASLIVALSVGVSSPNSKALWQKGVCPRMEGLSGRHSQVCSNDLEPLKARATMSELQQWAVSWHRYWATWFQHTPSLPVLWRWEERLSEGAVPQTFQGNEHSYWLPWGQCICGSQLLLNKGTKT